MKQQRISQFLASRQDRLITWLKQVVASLKGVREMNGAHPGFSRYAVQLLQTHLRIPYWYFDACHEPVGKFRMGFHSGIVNDLREMRTISRRRPLPWHTAA